MYGSAMVHVGMAVGMLTAMSACEQEVVTPVVVTRVTVEPGQAVLPQGDTLRFTASVFDERDQLLYRAAVAWSSEKPQVVSVAPDGAARSHKSGSSLVRASVDGVSGSAQVVVLPTATCRASTREEKDGHGDDKEDDDETDSRCAPPPG